MIKPFYQGKLDAFCAIYAVLNGLRLTHGIRTLKARDILNYALLKLSTKRDEFKAFLTQETDYIKIVDDLLVYVKSIMPLDIIVPYASEQKPTVDELWDTLNSWFGNSENRNRSRAVVFRFLRHINPVTPALNRHWTTADYIKDDILHLFDCSHEAEAILNIKKNSFVTVKDDIDPEHLLFIQPDTIRLLKLPF